MFTSTYGTMYYVTDMKKSVAFFKEKFKVTSAYESEGWTEFNIGGHNICLHALHDGKEKPQNGVLILKFEGVKALREKMIGEDIRVSEAHEVHPGHWSFHAYDPDGNDFSVYGSP